MRPEAGTDPSRLSAGWQASLKLRFANVEGRSILAHRDHRGPLLVQRPFYPEGDPCHVYVIHPPGGLVGGDHLAILLAAGPSSHALLTTPAAAKFYRSGSAGAARQQVDIEMNQASLEWLPQASIYYPDAHAHVATRIALSEHSKLIAWEVGCFGLPARNAPFSAGTVSQSLEVWLGASPLLLDRLKLEGASDMMHARWGLAGHSVVGTMVAYPATQIDVEAARGACGQIQDEGLIGVSLIDGLLICRALNAHVDRLFRDFVGIWSALRPRMMGRPAVPPRIWAT